MSFCDKVNEMVMSLNSNDHLDDAGRVGSLASMASARQTRSTYKNEATDSQTTARQKIRLLNIVIKSPWILRYHPFLHIARVLLIRST